MTFSQSPSSARPWRIAIPGMLQGQLAGIAQIYFLSSPRFGAVLLLCIYLSGPALALGCVLGVCAASCTAWALAFHKAERKAGRYGCNAALSGVGLCACYQLNVALLLWIVLAGMLTALLTQVLWRAKVPALTFQFVAVMWLAARTGPELGLLALDAPPAAACAMAPLGYAFCALGKAGFLSLAPLGMMLWAALARERWQLGLWVLAGVGLAWCVATLGENFLPGEGLGAQATGMGANCALALLGLTVLRRRWPWRLAGGVLSMPLCVWFGRMGLAYYTLPFVLAVWLVLPCSRLRLPRRLVARFAPAGTK